MSNNQHTIINAKIFFSLFSEYCSENQLIPYSKIFSKEFIKWINNKYGVLFILTDTEVQWIEQKVYITDPKKKMLFDLLYPK